MPNIVEHCYLTAQKFRLRYPYIHGYMDSYADNFHGPNHRCKLHHWEGIEECAQACKSLAGSYEVAYEIAKFHVECDMNIGGIQFPIPYKKDYEGGEGDWPVQEPWSNAPEGKF